MHRVALAAALLLAALLPAGCAPAPQPVASLPPPPAPQATPTPTPTARPQRPPTRPAAETPPPRTPHLLGQFRTSSLPEQSTDAAARTRSLAGAVVGGPPIAATVAALLGRDEQPAPPDRAFSLVLADAGPRTLALCRAMAQRLEFIDPQVLASQAEPTRPIYWMLLRTSAEIDRLTALSCDDLVAALDRTRAHRHGLDSMQGPKLRGIAVRGGTTIDVLWDLSDQPASELERAVRLWADLMATDPTTWQAQIGSLATREAFRGFLVNIGAPLSNMLGMREAEATTPRLIPISR
jgi:hypothetical protein